MRALVTGAAGFVGAHLLRLLARLGHEPRALMLPSESLAPDLSAVPTHRASVVQFEALRAAIAEAKPDWIIHLAALSRPADCREKPALAWEVNFLGTRNLYEAAAEVAPKSRVLFVGSASEYGRPATAEPITEDAPLAPGDVYAATKCAGDLLGGEFAKERGLAVIRVRPFNHTGPGQDAGFVAPDFARQIARIEAGLQESRMTVGNLDARRDFTDVRDVVRAYVLLLEKGSPGAAYNISSGRAFSARNILDGLLAQSPAKPEVVSKPGTPDTLVGSSELLHSVTGWQPEIPFDQTLSDLLADWRERTTK